LREIGGGGSRQAERRAPTNAICRARRR